MRKCEFFTLYSCWPNKECFRSFPGRCLKTRRSERFRSVHRTGATLSCRCALRYSPVIIFRLTARNAWVIRILAKHCGVRIESCRTTMMFLTLTACGDTISSANIGTSFQITYQNIFAKLVINCGASVPRMRFIYAVAPRVTSLLFVVTRRPDREQGQNVRDASVLHTPGALIWLVSINKQNRSYIKS